MHNNSFIIKVCGLRDADNIYAVEQAGANWLGFIFYSKSKRCVEKVPSYLSVDAKRVGVFVNESIFFIMDKVNSFSLDIVQLHGDESPQLCQQLHNKQIEVMKAFGVTTELPAEKIAQYEGCCDYFLFDTKNINYGGSGEKFNWQILKDYQGNTPFLLSGGIGPDDVQAVCEFSHPMCVGVDLNSQFEHSAGNKNTQSIDQFIKSIKQ